MVGTMVAPAPSGRMFQGVDKDSAAFRLMKQMGWEEGKGLGKNKQGIVSHLRVTKKADYGGLGVDEERKSAFDWTATTVMFDNILKNLQVKVSNGEKKRKLPVREKSGTDSRSSDDDVEDDEKECGGEAKPSPVPQKIARPQGRYKRREVGKDVRSYSHEDLSAILGVGTDALANARQQQKPINERQHREQETTGTVAAMDVKGNVGSSESGGKNNETEAAFDPTVAPVQKASELTASKKAKSRKKSEKTVSGAQGKREGMKSLKSLQAGKAEAKEECDGAVNSAQAGNVPGTLTKRVSIAVVNGGVRFVPSDDWWGKKFGFVHAGRLGARSSSGEEEESRDGRGRAKEFNEQDQENLYNLVQDAATSGRKGLGGREGPVKVGGVKWAGSKVSFEGEVEEEGEEREAIYKTRDSSTGRSVGGEAAKEEEDAGADASPGCPSVRSVAATDSEMDGGSEGQTKSNRKRKRETSPPDSEHENVPSGAIGGKRKIAWKKIITSVLKEGPVEGMGMKKLEKRVMKVVVADMDADTAETSELSTVFSKKCCPWECDRLHLRPRLLQV
eukprot:TRINITY_DN2018_c0_g1_i9.p1 TRINITY_DN2018_c0_g1~~TRINITY_DN2018_c0_g1_i9.p1  ORF type:complete len:574 (+),score=189.70 TRINITY_DN2018_c0_g1_i9:40-1722(+)